MVTKRLIEKYLKNKLPAGYSVTNEFPYLANDVLCLKYSSRVMGHFYIYYDICRAKPVLWNVRSIINRLH